MIAHPADGGEPVAQSPFKVDYFIPGDTIEYPLSLAPYLAAGEYELEVKLLTDCGFETTFTQPIRISEASVQQAAAEAQTASEPFPTSDEAARMLAQAELIRSLTVLVAVLIVLVTAGVAAVFVVRQRKLS